MSRVCIGIHVYAEPDRLIATLASIAANTSQDAECLLLADGPDAPTAALLSNLRGLRQAGTRKPLGAAACFNRLVNSTQSEVVVLLESGAQVGPRWLEYLLAALDSDSRNGLAGPSTNHCWNQQGVFKNPGDTQERIARTAREAAVRFGREIRSLEPLHSLADFCYMVRREVIHVIGGADEAYGLGPCWEMDYNIRAARAGFRGVWACGAYVHRAPFTVRRRVEEASRFAASKQRYQDKFCALRLRGEKADYETHCKGEECQHFAPPGLIELAIPLKSDHESPSRIGDSASRPSENECPVLSQPSAPMVSCVMVTRDRPEFVRQSIGYFRRQDYEPRELIIIDDGLEDLEAELRGEPDIRYIRVARPSSIGSKRNLGCELARGAIIAQWDDDDWYSSNRLTAQITPLVSGAADISGLIAGAFFDLPAWQFWRCTPDLHRKLFVADVHGGTLVYWRQVWERLARYADCSLAEDAAFLRQAIRRGARLMRLSGDDLFVYLRHATNSWSFECGRFLDARGWLRANEPDMPAADRAFYAARSRAATKMTAEREVACGGGPLVSCIMPTYNRRAFVPQAINYFLRQTYTHCELIIVDDGDIAIDDLVPASPRIRHLRLENRTTIGAKRNAGCESARGDLILHWDDDDWMASRRVAYQVREILETGADLCGTDKLLFYEPSTDRAWQYVYPPGGKFWVAGSTLCYSKSFWNNNPFPNINVGEDTRFVWGARAQRMIALEDSDLSVAIVHPGNTSPKRTRDSRYRSYPSKRIHSLIGEDRTFYANLK